MSDPRESKEMRNSGVFFGFSPNARERREESALGGKRARELAREKLRNCENHSHDTPRGCSELCYIVYRDGLSGISEIIECNRGIETNNKNGLTCNDGNIDRRGSLCACHVEVDRK